MLSLSSLWWIRRWQRKPNGILWNSWLGNSLPLAELAWEHHSSEPVSISVFASSCSYFIEVSLRTGIIFWKCSRMRVIQSTESWDRLNWLCINGSYWWRCSWGGHLDQRSAHFTYCTWSAYTYTVLIESYRRYVRCGRCQRSQTRRRRSRRSQTGYIGNALHATRTSSRIKRFKLSVPFSMLTNRWKRLPEPLRHSRHWSISSHCHYAESVALQESIGVELEHLPSSHPRLLRSFPSQCRRR